MQLEPVHVMIGNRKSAGRDREATEARILKAVGTLLGREGFAALGVNALAQEAGVDKVLIYRYFGGLPQLFAAYAREADLWWTADELVGDHLTPPEDDTLAGWLALALRRNLEALRRRPITVEILAWEMVERNVLTEALAGVREERSREVMDRLVARFGAPEGVDMRAMAAICAAAATYLVTRSRGFDRFLGLSLKHETGRRRLHDAIGMMVAGTMEARKP